LGSGREFFRQAHSDAQTALAFVLRIRFTHGRR
jgi:hypothetical protein